MLKHSGVIFLFYTPTHELHQHLAADITQTDGQVER